MDMGGMVWWILPAVTGIIGLMLVLAGIGKLIGLRVASGGARLILGAGALGITGVIAFAGLNLQTYKRLTYERPVATITFAAGEAPQTFLARVVFDGGEVREYPLTGDEWEMRARVIKFTPMANMLGYDSVYKLDRLLSGYTRAVGDTTVRVELLSENPGLDVFEMIRERKGAAKWVDASYGSGVYNPMAAGLSYDVFMTQDALIARPANPATKTVVNAAEVGQGVDVPTIETPVDPTILVPEPQPSETDPAPADGDGAVTETTPQGGE